MDNPLTAFLEFQASFPAEAEMLAAPPAVREGRETLSPDDMAFLEEFYRTEEVFAAISEDHDEDDLHSSTKTCARAQFPMRLVHKPLSEER
jgi:hypothetical protein